MSAIAKLLNTLYMCTKVRKVCYLKGEVHVNGRFLTEISACKERSNPMK